MDSCTLTAWIGQHSPADTDAETVGVKRVMSMPVSTWPDAAPAAGGSAARGREAFRLSRHRATGRSGPRRGRDHAMRLGPRARLARGVGAGQSVGMAAVVRCAQRGMVTTDGKQYFKRPGPRLVQSAEIRPECLHPACLDFGLRRRGSGSRGGVRCLIRLPSLSCAPFPSTAGRVAHDALQRSAAPQRQPVVPRSRAHRERAG